MMPLFCFYRPLWIHHIIITGWTCTTIVMMKIEIVMKFCHFFLFCFLFWKFPFPSIQSQKKKNFSFSFYFGHCDTILVIWLLSIMIIIINDNRHNIMTMMMMMILKINQESSHDHHQYNLIDRFIFFCLRLIRFPLLSFSFLLNYIIIKLIIHPTTIKHISNCLWNWTIERGKNIEKTKEIQMFVFL